MDFPGHPSTGEKLGAILVSLRRVSERRETLIQLVSRFHMKLVILSPEFVLSLTQPYKKQAIAPST